MSQTDPVTRTSRRYPESGPDADTLFALMAEFNELVEDTHDFCALLDADTGVTSVDYEDQLTAAQIDFAGYTNGVADPAPVAGLFGEFPVSQISEELCSAFNDQVEAMRVDLAAIVAKLTGDAGTTATFSLAAKTANRLQKRLTAALASVAQDSINSILLLSGRGHGQAGILLAVGTPDTGELATIMRSVDDGRTWQAWASLPVTVTVVSALVQLGEKLFLVGNTAAAGVIYTSADFGRTWSLVAHGATIDSVAFTDALVTKAGSLLVAGDAAGEVLRSIDRGSTWNLVEIAGPTTVNSLAELRDGSLIFACGDDAILYSSADDGASFAEQEDFSAGNDDCVSFLELANGWWAVATQDSGDVDELQISDDDGATFEAAVDVIGAVGAVGKMAQGPDGTLHIALAGDLSISVDNGATIEVSGVVFPDNDTVVAAFGHTRRGDLVVGTTNATDAAGLWLVGVRVPKAADAYAVYGSDELLTQPGAGYSGRWIQRMRENYGLLLEGWQALGSFCDGDGDIDTTDYEAAIGSHFLAVQRNVPEFAQHNVGHGASA